MVACDRAVSTSPRVFWGRWARFTSPEGARLGSRLAVHDGAQPASRLTPELVQPPVHGHVAGEDLHVVARLHERDALGEQLLVAVLGKAAPGADAPRPRVV